MSNKGKTWEEIYGVEGARKRREEIKKKKELGLLKKKTKGKTWDEIYGKEEADKRRKKMKEDNPIHKMSKETSEERSRKLSKNMSKRVGEKNPFYGKRHSEEFKQKLSEERKSEEWYNTVQSKINETLKIKHEEYVIKANCRQCGSDFEYLSYDTRTFCSQQCANRWKLENGIFNKNEPNTWEQKIINLEIENVKYVGNHSFWTTLFNDRTNKTHYKNPDFIIEPFSETKKVIEVWGEWWHRNDDIEHLRKMYNDRGIEVLFLRDEDIKQTNKTILDKIGGFINYESI